MFFVFMQIRVTISHEGFAVRRALRENDCCDGCRAAREQEDVCLLEASVRRPEPSLELVGHEPINE